jgi:hypothetical protein
MLTGSQEDRAAIDRLVDRFFAAFTNRPPAVPDIKGLAALFIPSGMVVKATGEQPEGYSVQSFIEPRIRLLTEGTLTDFREEETASRTGILGNVAQRISLYRKSGIMSGAHFEGKGVKVFQFVRTAGQWRIAAVAWDDERDGLTIPAEL